MSDWRIGVVGATGALGREVLAALDRAPWRPEQVVALASARTSTSHVEYGEARLAVDDVSEQVLDELDAVLLAAPPEVARKVGGEAMDARVVTIDGSGAWQSDADVPLCVPWINPERLSQAVEAGALTLPSPGALLLASALGVLARAGLTGPAEATVMLPASAFGRAGIDELSAQVIALFNSGTPPRKVFANGLAFDVIPAVGDLEPEGWTSVEERVRAELAALVPGSDLRATVIGAPWFTGTTATLVLRPNRRAPPELIAQLLADGGVVMPKEAGVRALPRPRNVDGRPFAHAGRVRVTEEGVIHLWLALDNLRATAAAMVAGAGALLRGRESA